MSLTKTVGLMAGAAALTLTGSIFADNDVSKDELLSRLAAAEARLAELETADNGMTERRADEIKGLVNDVLADADTRASLLQSGATSGYNNGFVVGSSDGNFKLKMNGTVQFRYIYNNRDNGGGAGDEHIAGFENHMTRLYFSGHVVNPQWTYMIMGEFGTGGGFTLFDSWIGYDYGNGWSVRAGQMLAPFSRESLIDDEKTLAVDYSVVDSLYGAGRVQGVSFMHATDNTRWHIAYTDGAGTANTAWGSAAETEYAFTTRFEYKASGTWDQFSDFTSAPGGENGWLIGGAFHYQDGEYGTGAIETEMMALTADVSGEFDGANIFVSGYYVDMDNGFALDVERYGFVAQGGFYFTDDVEGFARYEFSDLDGGAGIEDVSIVTVGVNKYFSGHQVKWTTDLGFSLEEAQAGGTGGFSPLGWMTDAAGEDSQMVLRSQLQLTF